MSSEQPAAASRPTNPNNSVNTQNGGISASQKSREIPTPEDRIAEFYDTYPDLAFLPLTEEEGQSLRRKFVQLDWADWESRPATEFEESVSGMEIDRVEPVTWGRAVERSLEAYEDTRKTSINLEFGKESDPEYAEFTVDAENRWMASYQKRYFAQLQAWFRELTGGERPTGGETKGIYEDPHVVLITRSASSRPDRDRLAPVDHGNSVTDSWEDCYHTLRNQMREKGLELGADWQYERRLEPHTGERGDGRGVNICYTHEHAVIVVDGEVEPEDFAPVIEKHLDECDHAGRDAHALEDAVEIKTPDDLEKDVATYVASYCGIEPTGLLERSVEYIAWAAQMDASNTRTKSRSDAAKQAAKADSCKQRYESKQADQSEDHGSSVVRSNRRGCDYECKHCGSPHEVDQTPDTLTDARRQLAADGGREPYRRITWDAQDGDGFASVGITPTELERRRLLEDHLKDVDPGEVTPVEICGQLGLPPKCADLVRDVLEDVDRPDLVAQNRLPEWRVVSVEVDGEEYPASAGNGIEMIEVSGTDKTADPWRCTEHVGDVIPETGGEIERINKRTTNGSDLMTCRATGQDFRSDETHLIVKTDRGRQWVIRDLSALREWVIA